MRHIYLSENSEMFSATRLAYVSRIALISIQFLANWLIPDHNAGVFVSPASYVRNETICDHVIETGLGGFRRWDAEYFLHIAEHGYTYENALAFYPLYPFAVRYATYTIQALLPWDPVCADRNQLLLIAIVLNVIFFAKAANALYALTLDVFKDRRIAQIAVVLFCFNPASVFFSAPYTESLFCWLCFRVMLSCKKNRFASAAIPLAASIWCRSNGLINFGFVAFYLIKHSTLRDISSLSKSASKLIAMAIVAGGAFFIVQVYFYLLYCTEYSVDVPSHLAEYANANNLVTAGAVNRTADQSPWCRQSFPISYGYIQSTYWNVGLFKYYEFKQIPNFLLAAPILLVILFNCWQYVAKNLQVVLTLGLVPINGKDRNQFVFIVHAFTMAIFCLLFVHIQVATRMLASSSPCLYWFVATHFTDKKSFGEILRTQSRSGKACVVWFGAYYCIGTILFCNFLPWTWRVSRSALRLLWIKLYTISNLMKMCFSLYLSQQQNWCAQSQGLKWNVWSKTSSLAPWTAEQPWPGTSWTSPRTFTRKWWTGDNEFSEFFICWLQIGTVENSDWIHASRKIGRWCRRFLVIFEQIWDTTTEQRSIHSARSTEVWYSDKFGTIHYIR